MLCYSTISVHARGQVGEEAAERSQRLTRYCVQGITFQLSQLRSKRQKLAGPDVLV